MGEIELDVRLREKAGRKGELSRLRGERMIPAVVYGGGKPPLSVVVAAGDLARATKTGGANAILRLKHPQGGETVILKTLDRHVVTHRPLHADFQRISLKEKIEVKVHLRVVGEAPGVKLHGGVLEHLLREVRVRALPTAIPQHIDVDVSRLELNQGLAVKDLPAPEGVELLDAPEHIVVNVVQPTAEAAAPAAAEATEAAAEPEVIAKGKKEAEGEAAAAAPAKGEGKAVAPAKKEGK